jgi:hypothetical protein
MHLAYSNGQPASRRIARLAATTVALQVQAAVPAMACLPLYNFLVACQSVPQCYCNTTFMVCLLLPRDVSWAPSHQGGASSTLGRECGACSSSAEHGGIPACLYMLAQAHTHTLG